jgi:hypothetical protein
MKKAYAIYVIAVLLFASCDLDSGGNFGFFDYDLRGTWSYFEEAQSWPWNDRSGTLVITMDSLKISGDVRPFKSGFTKDVALKGYSEETSSNRDRTLGNLFVQDRGTWQEGVPFNLWKTGDNETILTIGTGSEQDTLKRISN